MFLEKKIGYFDIYKTIDMAMEAHKNDLILDPSLDDIVACDLWARQNVLDNVTAGKLTAKVPA
jgi:1-deoxy-D-xylulose-5-phosphate reductoisomerase